MTLIAPIDDAGEPLPPVAILQSDENKSIFASSKVQLGINYFSADPDIRYPGIPRVGRNLSAGLAAATDSASAAARDFNLSTLDRESLRNLAK